MSKEQTTTIGPLFILWLLLLLFVFYLPPYQQPHFFCMFHFFLFFAFNFSVFPISLRTGISTRTLFNNRPPITLVGGLDSETTLSAEIHTTHHDHDHTATTTTTIIRHRTLLIKNSLFHHHDHRYRIRSPFTRSCAY